MREWNAETYHRVSNPQFDWGQRVLARLPLAGSERVLDIGCGTGRLTDTLLDRLPRGGVIALDLSANMLGVAREYLAPRHAGRVQFVLADATALPFHAAVDAVFSTATMHWVLDHPKLFASVHEALRPGGRFVAQCGGSGNIREIHDRADALRHAAQFARWFEGWRDPWEFATAERTAQRLTAAGFVDVSTSLEAAPVVFADANEFAVFITNVVARPYLARIPDEETRQRFIANLTEQAAKDSPPFSLAYTRLNIEARVAEERAE
jgi:trans-aconitate methyltransferase